MKKTFLLLLATISTMVATAQTPTSFPRKHLIEHFTGEECGYCPGGMAAIQNFLDTTSKNYIWVSHHYGYGNDEYTIRANSTIGQKLGINGAPYIVINRTKRRVNGENVMAFIPTWLEEEGEVPLTDADSAMVSVVIDRSYDAETRQLSLTVHGQVLNTDTILLLSVLIKENGTIGQQHDYLNTYEGWSEFRHVRTVRAMLSKSAMGDKFTAHGQQYSQDFTYTLPDAWNADNCVVVAYVAKSALTGVTSILNAEQIAVVEETDGGESLKAEGITRVPVSDTYPEVGAPLRDVTFSSYNVNSQYLSAYGFITLVLQSTQSVTAMGYPCTPYLQLEMFSRTSKPAAGVYPFSDEPQYGVFAAGYRDDEQFEIGGSMLYYVYNESGQLYPITQWLLVDGTVTIGTNGSVEVNATTLNGSKFHGVYGDVTPIEHIENAVKDGKLVRDGKVIILREGREYNLFGTRLK